MKNIYKILCATACLFAAGIGAACTILLNSNTLLLDISGLSPGTYLVRYVDGARSETSKLVKQ